MGLLVAAIALASAITYQRNPPARRATDEETRRVEVVADVERSVVAVIGELRAAAGAADRGQQRKRALGAGVIVRADGLVATAAHVVAGADLVRVKLEGVDPVAARVVFLDVPSDIALLRIEGALSGFAEARLGDSDRVRKGETVYVIGNPTGLERSLSVGVVSGRHPLGHVVGGGVEAEVIQTDAAVNPGNSGGPIFNSRGEVIAIAQLILSRSGGSDGLGFGLSVNVVKEFLALDPCTWLGFSGVPVTDAMAEVLNVPRSGGVLVQLVTPGSPAAQAGVRQGQLPVRVGEGELLLGGDVVLEANGMPFLEWVRTRPTGGRPGDRHEVRLLLLRSGTLVEVPISTVHRVGW